MGFVISHAEPDSGGDIVCDTSEESYKVCGYHSPDRLCSIPNDAHFLKLPPENLSSKEES